MLQTSLKKRTLDYTAKLIVRVFAELNKNSFNGKKGAFPCSSLPSFPNTIIHSLDRRRRRRGTLNLLVSYGFLLPPNNSFGQVLNNNFEKKHLQLNLCKTPHPQRKDSLVTSSTNSEFFNKCFQWTWSEAIMNACACLFLFFLFLSFLGNI